MADCTCGKNLEDLRLTGKLTKWHYIPCEKQEKIRIVFLFQAATVWASWESVYSACIKDDAIEVRLLLVSETVIEKSHMILAEEFLKERQIVYERFEDFDLQAYKPHIAFVQFPYDLACHAPDALSLRLTCMGIRVVYIPYGIEIVDTQTARKDHFENFVVENSWRIFTCCEAVREEYLKYCRNREAVRALGSPKFDGTAHREDYPLAETIKNQSGNRKIVLWKMHFSKKTLEDGKIVQITPELDEYISFAENAEKYEDLFFIVMMHPKMLYGTVGSDVKGDLSLKPRTDRLLSIIRTKENMYLDNSVDYRNSLYHADAVIMDRSAVMMEAAMTGKPILLMTNGAYKEKWSEGVRQVAETFEQGSTAKDMERFLEKLRQGELPDPKRTKTALNQYFPYEDGLCGFRIKEAIKRELWEEEVEKQAGRKTKIALYGAGEVCGYYLGKYNDRQKNCELTALADGSPAKWGTKLCGMTVQKPEALKEISFDILVIMTEQNYYEIKKKLVYELYIDERKIWRLDEMAACWGEEAHGAVKAGL